MRIRRFAAYAVVALLLAACREPTVPEISGVVLVPVTSPTAGVVWEFTEAPPTVRVTRASDGTPVSGVIVHFAPSNPNYGVIGAAADTSDAVGIATARTWRLGTRVGPQTLTVNAPEYGRVTFLLANARAGPPTQVRALFSSPQFVLNERQPQAPSVFVSDLYNNAVSGVAVTFTPSPGGGSLGAASSTTNLSGFASANTWQIPVAAGTYAVDAAVATRVVPFSAQRVDSSSLVWYGLDSLSHSGKLYLPSEWNIKAQRLGLSPFDPCLCVNVDGAFFEIVDYGGGGSTHFEVSGRLLLSGGKLLLSGGEEVTVSGNKLKFTRIDYYYSSATTWIYSKRN